MRFASEPPGTPPTSVASGGTGSRAEVLLRPRTNYRLSLLLIPCSVAFALIWIIGRFDPTTTAVGLTVSLVLVVGSVAAALYLKGDRTLVVDSRGVRLLRAGRTLNDVPWERMSRFRFGVLPFAANSVAPATVFWVHVTDRYRGLSVVESYYSVPPGSLWSAALLTAEMARLRGIPVVQKDGIIRDFGP